MINQKVQNFSTFISIFFILSVLFSPEHPRAKEKSRGLDYEVERSERQLNEIEEKIHLKKKEIEAIEVDEGSILSRLEAIEKKRLKNEKELKGLNKKVIRLEKEVAKLSRKLSSLDRDFKEKKSLLKKRLRAIYMASRGGYLNVIFVSDSLSDLMRRYKLMGTLIDYDNQLIGELKVLIDNIEDKKQKVNRTRKNTFAVKEEIKKKKRNIEKKKDQKRALLKAVRGEKKLKIMALKELEDASKNLQSLLEGLTKKTSIKILGCDFEARKGNLIWPAEGKVMSFFGRHLDKHFNTITFKKGIEINALFGSKVKAVCDGEIIYEDWFRGYGNLMVIEHGNNYYSLYGHLSEMFKEVGDFTSKGEVIGLVGDSGSFKGAQLYFEVRHKGLPQDPLVWLKRK